MMIRGIYGLFRGQSARNFHSISKDLYFQLQELTIENKGVETEYKHLESFLGKSVRNGFTIKFSKDQILDILQSSDINLIKDIFTLSNSITHRYYSNFVPIESFLAFCNVCQRNCLHCGIRKDSDIRRYSMVDFHAGELMTEAVYSGSTSLLIEGGEINSQSRYDYLISTFVKLRNSIKLLPFDSGIKHPYLSLSVGETSTQFLSKLTRYIHRYHIPIDTTDPLFYYTFNNPGRKFENRIKLFKHMKTLDIEFGTGILVGLPGQTYDILANDLLFFTKYDPDYISVFPYLPSANTPLYKQWEKEYQTMNNYSDIIYPLLFKTISLFRIMYGPIVIPAPFYFPDKLINIALHCGCNTMQCDIGVGENPQSYSIHDYINTPKEDMVDRFYEKISLIQNAKKLYGFCHPALSFKFYNNIKFPSGAVSQPNYCSDQSETELDGSNGQTNDNHRNTQSGSDKKKQSNIL